MAEQTVKVLRLDKPANSLAVWLAGHHPDLFLAMFKQARAKAPRLKGLADDDSPVISSDVELQPITVDQTALETLPSNLLTDSNSSGWGFLSTLGDTATSVGTTIGGALQSVGSGMLSALSSVGQFLGTPAGQGALTAVARTLAPTQQQVVQTQLGRTTVGAQVAPITYQNGVPVYATNTPQGTIYQPLTNSNIASLAPSDLSIFLSRYGGYVAAGAAVLVVGFTLARRS